MTVVEGGPSRVNGRRAPAAPAVAIPTTILKRDGRTMPFDVARIERAMERCFAGLEREPHTPIDELANRVVNIVAAKSKGVSPTVEGVQDIVEMVLQAAGEFEAAKSYILYRAERAKEREKRPVPDGVRAAFDESKVYFPTPIQQFQFFDKYSRFNYDLGRRETWVETVDRAVDYMYDLAGSRLSRETYERVRTGILEMRAMPSMRLLAMAGPAARRNSVAIYNCSYQPVDSIESFVEALIISMAGCGVGFSVESKYVENFPRIKRQTTHAPALMVVEDSAEGWADALRYGLETWFAGGDVRFDLTQLRPAGAPLKTKGGRASGPDPFRTMLDFLRARVLARQGSFLRPLDAHDMMCAVGNAAVSGGVRRCLPAGTRVHTNRGAIPIEEVTIADQVMTDRGYKPVTGWVDQGVQGVVEIVTESGTIFRCTPNHRVAVLTDIWGGHTFKYARDLTAEDRLLFITHPIDGSTQELLALPEKRDTDHSGSQVLQPLLTTETAWLIGKFFADGYVQVTEHDERGKGGNTQFNIASHLNEIAQIERITAWMEDHGVTARLQMNDGNWVQIRSGNRQIARWMEQYKQPNTPLVIPECIWRSPAEIRAAFVAGVMDGDGCYSDRPVTIVATAYESFGRDIVRLLATLGIIAEFRMRRPETEQGWQAQWVVSIKDALALQTAAEVIGQHACGVWVPRKGKQAGYTVPGEFVKRDLPRQRYASLWASGRDANMNSATLTTLVEATHYVPVGIVEVRAGGEAHTYDIEVRDGSMFVAEGYLVHNTAMISLFDYDDDELRMAKSGDFERENMQRWNANNSAVWRTGGVSQQEFIKQFYDMVEGGRGEPGIFNRDAALAMKPARRADAEFGTNPCGEIVLRPNQFCNLSAAVARSEDTFETLREKVEIATIIGTIQSMATDFPGLRPIWKQNCEEERLLGVDITGQMDSAIAQDAQVKRRLKEVAIEVNRITAQLVGINQSAAISCVKPSGNSSQLLNCASGLHARWAPYYVRNVRVASHSPLYKVLRDAGTPMDPENGQTAQSANTWVIHFPMKSPEGAITRNDRNAVEQCEFWLQNKLYWTEHNPSCFTGETRVVTDCGLMSFRQMEDLIGDDLSRTPQVLGKDGAWVDAAFRSLGEQEVWEMVVERCGVRQTIRTTANHVWPVTSPMRRHRSTPFELRTTSELPIGSSDYKLMTVNPQMAIDLDMEGVLHGITFGDGTRGSGHGGRTRFCSIALCDDPNGVDSRELASLFIEAGYSPKIHEDRQQISFYGLPEHWKQVPSAHESAEYLRGFVAGWFAADGHIGNTTTLSSVNRDALEWLQAIAPRAGLATSTAIAEYTPEGGVAPVTWSVVALAKETLDEAFFILRQKRERFAPARFAKYWKIVSVRNTGRSEPVFCMEVASDEPYFAIEGNILTHNCTITYKPDEVLDLMKWVWEHRDQVGGLSFLPSFDAQYAQMPYMEIDKAEYERLAAEFPPVDFSKVWRYEEDDLTSAAQELACFAGACEVEVVPQG